MSTEKTPFWIVWNPEGHMPTRKHSTEGGAESEAGRLAKEHPGKEFFVLQPISSVQRKDIVIRRFELAPF